MEHAIEASWSGTLHGEAIRALSNMEDVEVRAGTATFHSPCYKDIRRALLRQDLRLVKTEGKWIITHIPQELRNARWLRARLLREARQFEREDELYAIAMMFNQGGMRKLENMFVVRRAQAWAEILFTELQEEENFEIPAGIVYAAHGFV